MIVQLPQSDPIATVFVTPAAPVGAENAVQTAHLDFRWVDLDGEDEVWRSPFSTWPSFVCFQLIRLSWSSEEDLAVEVVVLRHEVAV